MPGGNGCSLAAHAVTGHNGSMSDRLVYVSRLVRLPLVRVPVPA